MQVGTRTDSTRLCNETTYCDPGIERYVWDGNQVLMELRDESLTTQYGSGSYNGRVAYTHGGTIDRPLDAIKGSGTTETLIPYVNWRGVHAGATGTDGQPCGGGSWCGNVRFAGDTRRAFLDEKTVVPARSLWWGSLVLESADASNLLYRRNRYYDPSTGQFTQEDPIGIAGGLTVYGYADGDPLGLSDPFGVCPPADDNLADCQYLTGAPPLVSPFPIPGGGLLRGARALAATRSFPGARAAFDAPSQFETARAVHAAVGGTLKAAESGKGFVLTVGEGNSPLVLRVMAEGGGRTNYFRLSRAGKETFTADGVASSNRTLTRISLEGKSAQSIIDLIRRVAGGN